MQKGNPELKKRKSEDGVFGLNLVSGPLKR
jgi:hypothetical protein